MRGADGVKIAVLRKVRADSEFFRAAAHAHVSHEENEFIRWDLKQKKEISKLFRREIPVHHTKRSPPNLDFRGAEFNKLSVDLEQMKRDKNNQQGFSES